MLKKNDAISCYCDSNNANSDDNGDSRSLYFVFCWEYGVFLQYRNRMKERRLYIYHVN